MSGINWDIVHALAAIKAKGYADRMPNVTVENAYFQGYIENSAELESIRIISARQAKRIEELERMGVSTPRVSVLDMKVSKDFALPPGEIRLVQDNKVVAQISNLGSLV